MGRRSGGNGETPTKTLWALRDVTVQVPRGRILGVVGANGAGKSTLLKILSGITRPTSGQAVVTGRVASLLEVGTGFHPELSGAENIYLSAAILGMPRTEIRRKFDEIVDFAGVRDLIDTPVKHYSSGLYLRLGFAVAAHLDAEILLIDEVLAVGDAQFQRRSTSKMQDVVKDGRTVLFVSHNLTAVRHVCDHAIWLREGRVVEDGPADRIVDHYAKQSGADGRPGARLAEQLSRAPDDPVFSLLSVQLEQGEAETLVFQNGLPVRVVLSYRIKRRVTSLRLYVEVRDEFDDILVQSFHDERAEAPSVFEPGVYHSTLVLPASFFAPREYRLVINATIHNVRNCLPPITLPISFMHTMPAHRAYLDNPVEAKLMPLFAWRTVPTSGNDVEGTV